MPREALLVSVVSHLHGALVRSLLEDLARCETRGMRVVLTLNVPEALPFEPGAFPFALEVVRNDAPRGFGANHNAAFCRARAEHFAVLNPDLRLPRDPFGVLLPALADPALGAVAPRIVDPAGRPEDHARAFPTPLTILAKLAGSRPRIAGGASGAAPGAPFRADWIAGMFMLFRSEAFAAVGGFDESYFLYYEDVDLCARLAAAGLRVEVHPAATAVHDARRESHRNLRFLLWHLGSMARFFGKRLAGRV
ncbi:MAG: galactosyltransferase-related protein [Betaproteobacteria bacterium]